MHGKPSKRNLFASTGAILTVSLMALFFNVYEPWVPVGPERIADPGFETSAATNQWSGWNEQTRLLPDGGFRGSPGVVLTVSSNRQGVLRYTVSDLTGIPAFRVSLRATARNVVPGKLGYHVPRAVFYYQDTKGKNLFSLRHGIKDLSKDKGWKRYTRFFPVPENAANARLHIQNLGAAGIMQIDDVSVIPVRRCPFARWWNLFFGTLWAASFVSCLLVLHPWKRRYGRLILMTAGLILTAVVLPGERLDGAIRETGRTAKNLIRKPPPPAAVQRPAPSAAPVASPPAAAKPPAPPAETPVKMSGTGVDNAHLIGHLVLFSLLAFLSALSWIPPEPSLRRAGAVLAGLLLFAAATETLQLITPDRAAGWKDLFVDAAGMTASVFLVLCLRSIQSKSCGFRLRRPTP